MQSPLCLQRSYLALFWGSPTTSKASFISGYWLSTFRDPVSTNAQCLSFHCLTFHAFILIGMMEEGQPFVLSFNLIDLCMQVEIIVSPPHVANAFVICWSYRTSLHTTKYGVVVFIVFFYVKDVLHRKSWWSSERKGRLKAWKKFHSWSWEFSSESEILTWVDFLKLGGENSSFLLTLRKRLICE
jgi:hypothetical protein